MRGVELITICQVMCYVFSPQAAKSGVLTSTRVKAFGQQAEARNSVVWPQHQKYVYSAVYTGVKTASFPGYCVTKLALKEAVPVDGAALDNNQIRDIKGEPWALLCCLLSVSTGRWPRLLSSGSPSPASSLLEVR